MKIFTFTDVNYFYYCLALCKSIRLNGNKQRIIVLLMDFNEKDLEVAKSFLKKIPDLETLEINSENYFKNKIVNREEFYRNYRINLYDKLLKEDKESLLSICANGIVRVNLDNLKDIFENNDMVFLERPRKNNFSKSPEVIEGVYELADMIYDNNLNKKINEILSDHTGRCVLTGFHFIKNNERSKKVVKKWKEYINENNKVYETKFCDMDYFVKSMIYNYKELNNKLKIYTAKNVPREISPICDTTFGDRSLVWFGKGPSKFQKNKYTNAVNFLINQNK